MEKFELNGNSTTNILTTPLVVCEFDVSDSLPHVTREVDKSTSGRYKKPNFYGVKSEEPLILMTSLVKENGEYFSMQERHEVEYWLKKNELPTAMKCTDKKGKYCFFDVVVTDIKWNIVGARVIGANISFECSGNGCYKLASARYTTAGTYTLDIESSEKYIYPRINLKNNNSSKTTITIKTNGKSMPIEVPSGKTLILDTEYMVIGTGETYSQLGFDKLKTINWPYLVSGKNVVEIDGNNFELELHYKLYNYGLGSYFGDIGDIGK